MRVFGYVRVSRVDQAESALGLDAQRKTIAGECERRGWELARVFVDEALSGKDMKRPALLEALGALKAHEGDALLVSKLDRLSRSVVDFAGLMQRSKDEGWALVALDLNVDTSTPGGMLMANVMASFAEYERRLIGQRTSEALQALKARGVKLGRPEAYSPELRVRIAAMAEVHGLSGTARVLNAENVPTGRGGRQWWPSTVRSVVRAG